jgi:hypothetical protein
MSAPNGAPVIGQKQVAVHQVIVRWVKETGDIQVASTPMDLVEQLGLLEMAKVAIQAQRTQPKGDSPLIVPARFQS